jgi:carbamate kinase
VIDKDRASALLAMGLHADVLVMATDVDAVYVGWGTPAARAVARAHPQELLDHGVGFAAGSMRPKVEAACRFAATGGMAAIGALVDVGQMVGGKAGTVVTLGADGMEFR